MTDYLPKAYDEDIRIRVQDQGLQQEWGDRDGGGG